MKGSQIDPSPLEKTSIKKPSLIWIKPFNQKHHKTSGFWRKQEFGRYTFESGASRTKHGSWNIERRMAYGYSQGKHTLYKSQVLTKSKYRGIYSRHRCISDASLRRLIQRLRDILKRVDLQISEKSPGRLIKDFSSETSLRSSQRRLWVASETVILGLQTKRFFWLPVHVPTSL